MSAPCDEQNSYNEDSGHGDDSFMLRSHYQGSPHFDLVFVVVQGMARDEIQCYCVQNQLQYPYKRREKDLRLSQRIMRLVDCKLTTILISNGSLSWRANNLILQNK